MAQRYGLPVRSITLHFLGGVTEIDGEPDTPRPRVRRLGGRPADLARGRRRGAPACAILAPDGSLLDLAVDGPGRRQPRRRRPQPGARPAARRRPGAARRWSGSSPATRTRARSWPAGAAGSRPCWCSPTRSPGSSLLGPPADITDYVFAFVIAASCGAARLGLDHVRAGTTPAAVPAGPHAGPPHARGPRRPAARGGGAPRPGRAGRQHRGARRAGGSERRSSTRPRCSPPPRTAGPGCRSARSPAPSSRVSRSPADIAGEPLILAMQKAPGHGVPPPRRRRQHLRRAGHRRRRPGLRRRHLKVRRVRAP